MKRFLALALIVLIQVSTTNASEYRIAPTNDLNFVVDAPTLPDISGYTADAAREILKQHQRVGKANTERLVENFEAVKFYRKGQIVKWAQRQAAFPKAIFVRDGRVSFTELAKNNPNNVVEVAPKTYHVSLPIIVSHNGVLVVEDGVELRFSEEKGAFLVNAGGLFFFNSKMIAWRDKDNSPAKYTDAETNFRPFLTTSGGSFTYLVDSYFESLGYQESMSYGISYIAHSKSTQEMAPDDAAVDVSATPAGWVIGSTFVDLFFGFYCYEAHGLIVLNNRYIDNIVYGIDPHDRSSHLIFAGNVVSGTKQKHGIITSREVNDSYFFNNVSYENKRSGFMLDRASERNVLANNVVHSNGGDGISIYESSHNLIWKNRVYGNKEHGIRIRNSIDITVQNNTVLSNHGTAIYFHTRDLSDHTHRNFELDPYSQRVSGNVSGGLIGYNASGAIYADNINSLKLAKLNMHGNGTNPNSPGLKGDLSFYQSSILRELWKSSNNPQGVILERASMQGE